MTVDYVTVPFKQWHLDWLSEENGGQSSMNRNELMHIETQNSWTIVADGTPVAAGGTIMQWPGRHVAWSFMGMASGPHMKYITRKSREIIDLVYGRVEMTVRSDFEAGNRWARMLGFEVETPVLKSYGPMGEDHVGYMRFR